MSVSQSELVAELFQQQGNSSSVANGSVRSGKRATREHKLTVGFQVSPCGFADWFDHLSSFNSPCLFLPLSRCLAVPSVLAAADGHPQRHRSSLCPLYQAQRSQRTFYVSFWSANFLQRFCVFFQMPRFNLTVLICQVRPSQDSPAVKSLRGAGDNSHQCCGISHQVSASQTVCKTLRQTTETVI